MTSDMYMTAKSPYLQNHISFQPPKSHQNTAPAPPNTSNQSYRSNSAKKSPKLFTDSDLKAISEGNVRKPFGLVNLGNSCYFNSVVQSLLSTPLLFNYFQSDHHEAYCVKKKLNSFCSLCAMKRMFPVETRRTVSPTLLYRNIRLLCRSLSIGRQEDAHEFLRVLLQSFIEASSPKKAPEKLKLTSALYRIFGGFVKSSVTCKSCSGVSSTYDPFLDLSLDIQKSRSVRESIARFSQADGLYGANQYNCDKCHKKVDAVKRMSLYRLPLVLTVHLKRFDVFGRKLEKRVTFSEVLQLGKTTYELYSIVVHSGSSSRSGHYVSYVKSFSGVWYLMNDSSVSQVSVQRVLAQNAYILFYTKKGGVEKSESAEKVRTEEQTKDSTAVVAEKEYACVRVRSRITAFAAEFFMTNGRRMRRKLVKCN